MDGGSSVHGQGTYNYNGSISATAGDSISYGITCNYTSGASLESEAEKARSTDAEDNTAGSEAMVTVRIECWDYISQHLMSNETVRLPVSGVISFHNGTSCNNSQETTCSAPIVKMCIDPQPAQPESSPPRSAPQTCHPVIRTAPEEELYTNIILPARSPPKGDPVYETVPYASHSQGTCCEVLQKHSAGQSRHALHHGEGAVSWSLKKKVVTQAASTNVESCMSGYATSSMYSDDTVGHCAGGSSRRRPAAYGLDSGNPGTTISSVSLATQDAQEIGYKSVKVHGFLGKLKKGLSSFGSQKASR